MDAGAALMNTFLFRFVLVFLIVPTVVALAEEQPVETPPATQPATQTATQPEAHPDGRKALSDLASHPKLLLTNDAASAHDRFSYAIAINPPPGGSSQATTILVVRDGDHIGVVVGARGLPSYYMTDGLFIAVDPKNPGQLMMHEGGSVKLEFGGKEAGGNLAYSARGKESRLVLDPAALIKSLAGNIKQSEYRPELFRLTMRTEAGDQLKIKLPQPGKENTYPIENLMFQAPGPSGLTFAFGSVTPNVVLKKSIAGRTLEDVRKLGMTIRKLSDQDLEKDYAALARADFAENEEEQEAAEKLRGLFPDDEKMEGKP
jgi:hypothetical protein